jgi:UDP-N-acetylglucosamine 1-carboxyvinyltransferase
MILAGLAAQGETHINDAQHVDRGYENLVEILQQLGGQITRTKS